VLKSGVSQETHIPIDTPCLDIILRYSGLGSQEAQLVGRVQKGPQRWLCTHTGYLEGICRE
jgi:hypothetical protein